MAMDAKYDFLRELEKGLGDEVKSSEMASVLRITADILEGYDMQSNANMPEEHDDCLDCYISAMVVSNRSQKTIDRYRYIIKRMMDYVHVSTRRITVHHLRSYLQAEKARGISDSTLEGYREIFSAYFNWLQRERLIDQNPVINLGAVKCEKKDPEPYTSVEVEMLNQNCGNAREKAILAFLESTGCRVSEMCACNRNSVNLSTLECKVHGKGNKWRTVFLGEVAGMLIGKYLETRTDDDPALFVSRFKTRITPGGVRAILKSIAKRANVDHCHPHKFRRTLATNLNRHGMPVEEVAKIMGHEKLDTTMKYVKLNKDDVKASYRRYA